MSCCGSFLWLDEELTFAFECIFRHFFSYNKASYCSFRNWSCSLISCFCLFLILWNQAWHWFGIWHVFNCLCIAHDGYLTWNTGPFIKYDLFALPLPSSFIIKIISSKIYFSVLNWLYDNVVTFQQSLFIKYFVKI